MTKELTSKLQGSDLVLPKPIVEALNLHPDDHVELFKHTATGQMEFSAVSQLGYDDSITLSEDIVVACGNRDICEFIPGRDMVTVRVRSSHERETSTRERMATKGTLAEGETPVDFRIYKHLCAASKPSIGYIAQSETCALCGAALKKEHVIPKVAPKPGESTQECPRCHRLVGGNFCSHCGLKLSRVRKPFCPECRQQLSFIQKYARWYCYKCGQYRAVSSRLKKPTCRSCNKELAYIKQYDRWYCRDCKKYAPKIFASQKF